MAKQPTSRIGRARGAVRTITPLILSTKAWWDGLSDKEKARYVEQARTVLRQAQQVGKSGLDAAKARTGGSKKRKR
jgi:hypothetical protein